MLHWGVDYDGSGEIDALGDAQITFAGTGIGAAGPATQARTAASSIG
jgi:hypothetical protein